MHPRRRRLRLLFLQVPRLDPDISGPTENVMLAAAGLRHALRRAPEGRHWRVLPTPPAQERDDNRRLLAAVLDAQPDALAASLYLWNVERTLRLLAMVKQARPGIRIIAGGPEVAPDHPLLERARGPDAVVIGEGELAFPRLLRALRTGTDWPAWRNVGRCAAGGIRWGSQPPPVAPLARLAPHPTDAVYTPDAHGMAYLEASRGCPWRCAFCCYPLRRRQRSALPPAAVAARLRVMLRRGAREVRLVDPTFNAHPRFRGLLRTMARANRRGRLRFFVELRADLLAPADVRLLQAARVGEAEIGVQSTDPAVLDRLRRPTDLAAVRRGLALLRQARVKPTIDFLYGLPGQDAADLRRSIAWLAAEPDAHPQFLPLLLLPGTELRRRCRELGLQAQRLPPYRVLATDRLRRRDLAAAERLASERLGGFDSPTRRFVGRSLPDLFAERLRLPVGASGPPPWPDRGTANRRAVIWSGPNLFAWRETLAAQLRQAVRREPDILWQFVLEPRAEEPLDLLDCLLRALRQPPGHWLDRLVSPPGARLLAARRLFVRLPRGRRFDPDWRAAAEELLRGACH